MSTLTVYGDTADDTAWSSNAAYSTARSGSSLALIGPTTTDFYVGQNTGYQCYEGFISFDTSSIPDSATITAVELSLYVANDVSSTDFTIRARAYDWGASVDTGDWIAGASLPGNTLLAELSTSGLSVAAYSVFTSEAGFLAAISKTGTTRIALSSSRHEAGNTPTTFEYVRIHSGDQTGAERRPRLTVTYTTGVTVTRDVTTAAAISVATTREVSTAAATSVAVTRSITSAAALSVAATRDVTSAAALSIAYVYSDLTSAAAVSAAYASDVTSGGAVSRTPSSDATSAGAIGFEAVRSVSSAAALFVSGQRSHRMGGGSVSGTALRAGVVSGGVGAA